MVSMCVCMVSGRTVAEPTMKSLYHCQYLSIHADDVVYGGADLHLQRMHSPSFTLSWEWEQFFLATSWHDSTYKMSISAFLLRPRRNPTTFTSIPWSTAIPVSIPRGTLQISVSIPVRFLRNPRGPRHPLSRRRSSNKKLLMRDFLQAGRFLSLKQ